jgi:hypothetical protein
MNEWVFLLAVIGAILYRLKSIHIDFVGRGGDEDEEPSPKSSNRRKQLKS